MIDVRRQEDHYHHQRSWLRTDWHFSFGEYRDPDNRNFGPLRVVNNDHVDGGGGFPTHSHDNMEIITWVIEGELAHEDSSGGGGTIRSNGVQTMSAGTGIAHSEFNPNEDQPVHLLQVWIEPDTRGLEPRYEDASYSEEELRDRWVPVASGSEEDAGTTIHQDATMYVRHVGGEESFAYDADPDRRAYGILIAGESELGDAVLHEGDAARIRGESRLAFEAQPGTQLMLIDLP